LARGATRWWTHPALSESPCSPLLLLDFSWRIDSAWCSALLAGMVCLGRAAPADSIFSFHPDLQSAAARSSPALRSGAHVDRLPSLLHAKPILSLGNGFLLVYVCQ